jgi:RimJ/RimL family protein N-acetyltransferase
VVKPLELSAELIDKMAEVLSLDSRYFSDEHRSLQNSFLHLHHWFKGGYAAEAYEVGNMGGIMIFRDVVEGHKGNVFFIVLDKKQWGAGVLREAVDTIASVMKKYRLAKIEVETATKEWADFLVRRGFELEGVRRKSYMKNGEMVDFYLLALFGEV